MRYKIREQSLYTITVFTSKITTYFVFKLMQTAVVDWLIQWSLVSFTDGIPGHV